MLASLEEGVATDRGKIPEPGSASSSGGHAPPRRKVAAEESQRRVGR